MENPERPGDHPPSPTTTRSTSLRGAPLKAGRWIQAQPCPFRPTTPRSLRRSTRDFFQVAIDSSGRANIAYASDISSTGNASTGYTRQNVGLSALTGQPVARHSYVQPTVSTGTSCPAPQVLDPATWQAAPVVLIVDQLGNARAYNGVGITA